MPLQIPPAVGSSGQFVETVIVTSSQQRHVMVIGDGVSTAYGPVTSSAGQLVQVSNPSTTVTVTNAATTAVNTLSSGPVLVLSSGPMTIAGTVIVLSASSGLVQISGIPTVIAASSAGHQVGSLTSGIVSPSSNWTVVLSSIPSLSSGTVTLSSAPLVIVASSGGTIPVTLSTVFSLSSVPTVITASSGFASVALLVTSTAGYGPVTSSAGQLVSVSSGTIIMSSVQSVTATAATNPWSSAPGFNMPIVSASSGLVQLTSAPLVIVATSGGVFQVATTGTLVIVSASSGLVQALTTGTLIVVSASSGRVQTFASTTDAVAPTFVSATTISKLSSNPAVLQWLYSVVTCSTSGSNYMRLYDATTSSVVMNTSVKLILPLAVTSMSTVTGGGFDPVNFLPPGMSFTSGISFDCVAISTSTAAVVTANVFVTAMRV